MKNRKITVFVKHYLSVEGHKYFLTHWYPLVYSAISQQKGFISIVYGFSKDDPHCVDICVMFENEDLLDAWTKQPIHDGLVDALDKYRDRNYFEAVRVYDVEVDPATLEWTKYTIK